jgi:hypothetical protein
MRGEKIGLALLILLILVSFNAHPEIFYPWKDVYLGALEAGGWCGLVFAPQRDVVFAFRFKLEKEGQITDGRELFYLVSEVGPHSPDGQYARVKLDLSLPFKLGEDTPILIKPSEKEDTLTLEWSRQDERTVVGRITGPKNIQLRLVHYFPWDFKGGYRFATDNHIQGESREKKKLYYLLWTNRSGKLLTPAEGPELETSFLLNEEKNLYFVGGVGEDPQILKNSIYRYKNKKTIDSILEEEAERYSKKRVKAEGLHKGVAEAITNNIFWMTLYQPGKHRLYTPAGRKWLFPKPDKTQDHWTIFEWDSFFNALEASVESFAHASSIIRSVLETQYPNGNIPNWRGQFGGTPDRSQPPVGAYAILKIFQKSGDMDLLQYSYPYLKKWHSFWKAKKPNGQTRRDGNGDGLLEWGSDAELVGERVPAWEENASGESRAKWESGQDDLPSWDDVPYSPETGTLTMNCLDLNSLYALDAWCLAQMANILNIRADHEIYLKEYEEMKALINLLLWNEREGFYFDRHWDGQFSPRKAASNFYPLLAQIPDEKRALRMLRHLLNPKEYWGDYIVPSISRDDPAFKDQQYWRGTIWPPTNYLIYQGLKAYGFDAIASEFATKSSELFLRTWKNLQLCPENFDSRSGEAGGERYQSWGPLFALIALEDYLDFTPWEGFRFGMIKPEKKGKISRIAIQGRHYDVEVSSSETKLREEGREIFKVNKSAVIRHFLYSENEISFEARVLEKSELRIQFLKKGKYQLSIDDQPKRVFSGDSVKFDFPEGRHSVLILLLSAQE